MSVLALFITAIIWGVAFVAQSEGMDYLGPFSFNAIRYGLGSVVLIPVVMVFRGIRRRNGSVWEEGTSLTDTVKGGVLVGLALCAASLFQQFGIIYTTVGKAGFLTALYIVIVPFYGVLLHKKIPGRAWLAAGIAIVGFYLMCMTGSVSLSVGDGLVLISAFIWGVQIMLVDKYAPKADAVMLSSIEFGVSSLVCTVLALIYERNTTTWKAVTDCAIPLLYAGLFSCGIAYTLQVVAQKKVRPALACLIMSLEAVFSALAGWVILGQAMRPVEIAGCALVFAGVVIAQI
jgi:drug/metabolite transporter (DMT)-like permease